MQHLRKEPAGRAKGAGEYLPRYLTSKLKVNEAKSAFGRPWERKFLGFSRRRFRPSLSVEKRFKERIREITGRTRGRSIRQVVRELRAYLLGWREYFGHSELRSGFKELDSWIRRRLRSYHRWGRRGYRELRGVSRPLAWNTAKSAHGVLAALQLLPSPFRAKSSMNSECTSNDHLDRTALVRDPGGVGGERPRGLSLS